MTESERILYIVERVAGGNQSEFSRKCGINPPTLNKIIKGRNGLRLTDFYRKKIIAAYPIVRETFLIGGEFPSGLEDDSTQMTMDEMRQEITRLRKIIDILLTKF